LYEWVLDPSLMFWAPLYRMDATNAATYAAQHAVGTPCVVTGSVKDTDGHFFNGDDYHSCGDVTRLSALTALTVMMTFRWRGTPGTWNSSRSLFRKENVIAFGGGWIASKARCGSTTAGGLGLFRV
jgi:hypothetical protein